MRIALQGKLFNANNAKDHELINKLEGSKDFEKKSDSIISNLLAGTPLTLAASKQLLTQGLGVSSIEEAFQKNLPNL